MSRARSLPILLVVQFLLGGPLFAFHSVECFMLSLARRAAFAPIPEFTLSVHTTTQRSRREAQHKFDTRLDAVAKTGGKVLQSAEEFTSTVLKKSDGPILVFFTAPWCGPCRLSVPVVKEIMKEFSESLQVVEVCTDDLPEVASDADVVSIPTIQMYNNGQVMDTIVGCVAQSVLSSSVSKVLEDIEQQNQ
eukprot:CAMPEP_0168809612 /NCGR_PEP_ID=MMETSP0726-20121227/3177_1 /TAXON_ID=265536 /ORGANISM="Amphiprora sp., Strain CCMP467" /LENGTH=190 /DNA_ID=CAMNT_0008861605 /DNA_START=97 /DNA_END=669 /DNA_ORIENTATION=+